MPAVRVVGLGQPAAGDDGAGLAVVDRLRARGVPGGVEVLAVAGAPALADEVRVPCPVVVVDALVGAAPGEVRIVAPEDLGADARSRLSGHGLGVGEAIALARAIDEEAVSPNIRVVAIGIGAARPGTSGLSPEVEAGVARAVELIFGMLERLPP